MKRRWTIAALAMAVACGVYLLAGARAQEAGRRAPSRYAAGPQAAKPASAKASPARPVSPSPAAAPAFDGKLVAVYVRGAQQAKLIEQVRFMELNGRKFLVGKEVAATMSFPLGTDAHVAWDAVDAFYAFDSVEQYEMALQKALRGVGDSMGAVLEEVFSGGQKAEELGDSPREMPATDPPPEPYIIRFPDGRETRMIGRVYTDSEGRERIIYEAAVP